MFGDPSVHTVGHPSAEVPTPLSPGWTIWHVGPPLLQKKAEVFQGFLSWRRTPFLHLSKKANLPPLKARWILRIS